MFILIRITVLAFLVSLSIPADADAATDVRYRTVNVDGVDIFYREAGDATKPVILLLHGFPTSSHMFRNLMPALANDFHLVAPDYPGFGHSAMPSVDTFKYTFQNLADIVESFTDQIGLARYSLYLMDNSAPIGYRLATVFQGLSAAYPGSLGRTRLYFPCGRCAPVQA